MRDNLVPLWLFIALLVAVFFFWVNAEGAVTDRIIDPGPVYMMGTHGKMGAWGSRSVILYTRFNEVAWRQEAFVTVIEGDGTIWRAYLPGIGGDSGEMNEASIAMSGPDDLWLASGNFGASVRHYRLNADRTATLLTTHPLGSPPTSRARNIAVTSRGAILVGWYVHVSPWSIPVDYGVSYLTPGGAWDDTLVHTFGLGGNIQSSHMAVSEHPADGSLWACAQRDSYNEITCIRFHDVGGRLTFDWVDERFIDSSDTTGSDGEWGPHGEHPWLVAVPDAASGKLLLAYERHKFINGPNPEGQDSPYGAYIAIAQIASSGARTFIDYPFYVDRTSQFGLAKLADGTLWIAGHDYDPAGTEHNRGVYARRYSGGTWSSAFFLGSTAATLEIAYHPTRPLWALKLADDALHLLAVDEPVPPPPPPPKPCRGKKCRGR